MEEQQEHRSASESSHELDSRVIIVPEHQKKERLDQFIANRLERPTRSQIQKLIRDGFITVDDKQVKSSYTVSPGERIFIQFQHAKPPEFLPEKIPLNIIFEDEYLLVVNKQAGLVVHPAYGNLSGTLVNGLLYHCRSLSSLSGEYRPGLVHRLDKDTSGLLVIAKTDFVHSQLSAQFSKRTIQREYRAFAWGSFEKKQDRIKTHLRRSAKDRTRMTVSKQGKPAITNYEVISEYPLVSFLKVRLETGRTHQIRVHLAWKGHPVVGDDVYGGRKRQAIGLNQYNHQLALKLLDRMPRQALHAKTLGFIHPETKKEMWFDSDLPEDMQDFKNFLEERNAAPEN